MVKRFLLLLLIALSVESVSAQRSVTKFLGIPVDGSIAIMRQKLIAKGFVYDKNKDCLRGEFNDASVWIHIVANNNKVWRIAVEDVYESNSSEIKLRFNKLCTQFINNGKYVPVNGEDFTIEKKDYIGIPRPLIEPYPNYSRYQKKDKYEAVYYQLDKNSTQDEKRIVWFTFKKYDYRYRIWMYYDNEYNRSNGEDL